jgi:ribosome-associated protein
VSAPSGAEKEREASVAERRAETPAASAELARRIARIVDAKQGADIVALDVRELVAYTDYLVIATARNERQAKAIHDEVHALLKREDGRLPARVEGEREARWLLADYVDCVLHVFVPELRDRYRLERLWGEAPRLELGFDDARRSPQGEAEPRRR